MQHLLRFAVICICLVGLALAAPRFAPVLMATYLHADGPASVTPAMAQPAGHRARTVTIADDNGSFLADAEIDGRAVPVVIDTGATTVALTAATAHRLGIDLAPADFTARIATANGTVAVAPVTVDEIDVGGIRVRGVSAVVVPAGALEVNLLGMSFLNRLTRFSAGGGQLVLTE